MNENVKQKSNTGLIVLVIILLIVILVLGVYIVNDKINKDNEVTVTEEATEENTSEVVSTDISGIYTFVDKNTNDEEITYTLYLNEDGLFEYRVDYMGYYGIIGNYIVDNDKLILNYLFEDKSGGSIYLITKGSRTLNISSDLISDSNESIDENITSTTTINLEKNSTIDNISIIDNLNTGTLVTDENLLP